MFSVEEIQNTLAKHRPAPSSFEASRQCAAVAMILVGRKRDLELCMIRRAQKSGDPWSGQMAFPGGRFSPDDADLQATAERETHEEVGLFLDPSHRLGPLEPVSIWLSGREQPLYLFPTVYYLGEFPLEFTLNHEVAEAYWMPLGHPWDAKNATHLNLSNDNTALFYPAIRFEEQVIWGITLRVLTLFSDILGRPLPHLEEIPGLGR